MANPDLKTLEDKLSYAYDTKLAIKDAIVAKGVDIPEDTTFRDYAAKIVDIKTGGTWIDVEVSPEAPLSANSASIMPMVNWQNSNAYITIPAPTDDENLAIVRFVSFDTNNGSNNIGYAVYIKSSDEIYTTNLTAGTSSLYSSNSESICVYVSNVRTSYVTSASYIYLS